MCRMVPRRINRRRRRRRGSRARAILASNGGSRSEALSVDSVEEVPRRALLIHVAEHRVVARPVVDEVAQERSPLRLQLGRPRRGLFCLSALLLCALEPRLALKLGALGGESIRLLPLRRAPLLQIVLPLPLAFVALALALVKGCALGRGALRVLGGAVLALLADAHGRDGAGHAAAVVGLGRVRVRSHVLLVRIRMLLLLLLLVLLLWRLRRRQPRLLLVLRFVLRRVLLLLRLVRRLRRLLVILRRWLRLRGEP
mmetsp:Transcript_31830/g.110034  ORF Transcript_31830/g.110034 Transcript_31830/m.110034 type:complete len:256 (-) Transcript_31830:370-1137(-)